MRQQNRRVGKKKFIVGADVGNDTTDPVPQTETTDNEEEDRENVEETGDDAESLAAAEAEGRLNEPLEQCGKHFESLMCVGALLNITHLQYCLFLPHSLHREDVAYCGV